MKCKNKSLFAIYMLINSFSVLYHIFSFLIKNYSPRRQFKNTTYLDSSKYVRQNYCDLQRLFRNCFLNRISAKRFNAIGIAKFKFAYRISYQSRKITSTVKRFSKIACKRPYVSAFAASHSYFYFG